MMGEKGRNISPPRLDAARIVLLIWHIIYIVYTVFPRDDAWADKHAACWMQINIFHMLHTIIGILVYMLIC